LRKWNLIMKLTPDSLVLVFVCSHLALPENVSALTLREWNPLARFLQKEGLRPENLLGMPATELQSMLNLSIEASERLAALLDRGEVVERELARLASTGIGVLTRVDADYPARYRQRLKESAPPVLFYAGEKLLLGQPGIAVVGSRNLDEAGQACAAYVGNACGISGQVLYSGGARGVDTISMESALEARGTAAAVLADSLERQLKPRRAALERGDLCLVTPYSPNAGFSVGAAMGRNKLIYTLADYAVIVASDVGTGGTWSGGTEALKNNWLPVFVLSYPDMPEGNRQLMQRGALPFPYPFTQPPLQLSAWLQEQSSSSPASPAQPALF
jgi:predicted Rossmann fold nucleotide-binding protein DprA/Smf involved in DNA uptake